eukprot:TCALIF_05589-PA protein Name:"Protein of unknown function" AED:0.70 eAED:0.70 QI:0/0/0/0.5/0/0.5/2/0/142
MTVKQPRVTTTTTTAASPNSSSVSASRTGSSSSSSSSSVPSHSTVGSRPTEHQAQPGPNTSSPNKIPKPIPASDWSVVEVQNWFRRKCGEYYHLYSEKLLEQGITVLMGLTIHIIFFVNEIVCSLIIVEQLLHDKVCKIGLI